jgi:mannan endo-1,4-beta-mannosidase
MFNKILSAIIILFSHMPAQDFITASGSRFLSGGTEFNFLGFNAYYLFTEAAYGRKYVTDEVFDAANEIGVKVVRTWAFYESDKMNAAVIRYGPYNYNENALQALDYVVAKAKEKNIKLILTLCNNHPDYGGVKQYLTWGRNHLNREFRHNSFFTDDTLKSWYKEYMSMILNRINIYTNTAYKDEIAIFSFELINEGAVVSEDVNIINRWYSEMAEYFKSIDRNHLLSTGEAGEDDDMSAYSDINLFYNSRYFLFNGIKGTSYSENLSLPDIDYGSFHLYAEGWGMHYAAGQTWIKEHLFIAETLAKPSLLSEFGSRQNKPEAYSKWLRSISSYNCRSAVIWQYLHPDVNNTDGYGFNLSDTAIVDVLKNFAVEISSPTQHVEMPLQAELFQNYPNPFNPVTTIKYDLFEDGDIRLELFSITGERVGILDEGFKKRGRYELTLSFDRERYSSGTYIYSLRTSSGTISRKLVLLK